MDISFNHTDGRWRAPGSWLHRTYPDPTMYEDLARIAERGCIDMLFCGDGTGIPSTWQGSEEVAARWGIQWPRQDMSPYISVMSRVTEHLGFALTYSSTFMPPFYVARLLNSLDHLIQHVGRRLEAYIFERVVQLFKGTELLATHVRASEKGTWRTNPDHYPPAKAAYLEKTPRFCRETARRIGPATFEVVDTLLAERPLDRLRSVQAILRLTEAVGKSRLEAACKRALHFGDSRYRRIKDILNAALDQQPLPDTPPVPKNTQAFLFARSVEEFFDEDLLAAGAATEESQPC